MITLPSLLEGRCISALRLESGLHPVRLLAAKEALETVTSPRRSVWLLGLFVMFALGSLALILKATGGSYMLNNQALSTLLGLITGLGAVFATVAGTDAIAGEQERGSWTSLLVAPLSSRQIVRGKLAAPLAAWGAILILTVPALWALGSTTSRFTLQALGVVAVGTPVVLGFGFLAFGLAARLSSGPWALSLSLGALGLAASPIVWDQELGARSLGAAFETIDPFWGALRFYDAVANQPQTWDQHGAYALPGLVWLVVTSRFALASHRHVQWRGPQSIGAKFHVWPIW
ncbi:MULTISPECIES: ABC transporter permease subunit [Bosea]|uniref:ABC transporter permease subunit n=1 Tax=Bosea spartocytisi TaxID=2773451 RepID=A0A927I0I6_9HYPH|nr:MULTISPECIES: ABC transporter permease subunit [Bosea]MBD3847349.1 ABC transporter permease subunit [Bosea spartocytisi]MCP4737178.1 ABC transporter permease subunit [Bosea sp. (in: a-proteobacteria)]MCT4475401.1 ABC transporter permease [Bosea spartocytisi]